MQAYACLCVHVSNDSTLAGIQLHQLLQRLKLRQFLCKRPCKNVEDLKRRLQPSDTYTWCSRPFHAEAR